jgi:hypothetical protein
MPRTKLPNGRRKPIGTKVSEQEYAAVERVRGDLERSEWIRGLILKALAAEGLAPGEPAPPPVPAKRAARKTPDRQTRGQKPKIGPPASKAVPPPPPPPARALRPHAPGTAVFQEPDGQAITTSMPPAPSVQRKKCTHRGYRMIGGFCPDCNHPIEGGDTALWKVIPGHCPECDRLAGPGGYWREET